MEPSNETDLGATTSNETSSDSRPLAKERLFV